MAPLAMAALSALITSFIGAGTQAAMPKYGLKTPGDVPEGGSGELDFNQLLQQQGQESQLPELSLRDRLPEPEQY